MFISFNLKCFATYVYVRTYVHVHTHPYVYMYIRTYMHLHTLYIQNYITYSTYVHFMDAFVIAGLNHFAKDWVKMG